MISENIFNRAELLESLDNDETIANEIIGIFLTDMPARLAALGEAAAAADHGTIRGIAHAVKGAASYVYAQRICQAAATLEAEAKNGVAAAGEYGSLVAELARHYQEFLLQLEQKCP